jgi:hypothetical protein
VIMQHFSRISKFFGFLCNLRLFPDWHGAFEWDMGFSRNNCRHIYIGYGVGCKSWSHVTTELC